MGEFKLTGGNSGIRVSPLSNKAIQQLANATRHQCAIQHEFAPDIAVLMERLLLTLDVCFEVRSDSFMGDSEAYAVPARDQLVVNQATYEALSDRRSGWRYHRARFTIGHEIGHLVMHRDISMHRGDLLPARKPYEDAEWQANAFAGAFLAPAKMVAQHCGCVDDIVRLFDISRSCAAARARLLKKEGHINWKG